MEFAWLCKLQPALGQWRCLDFILLPLTRKDLEWSIQGSVSTLAMVQPGRVTWIPREGDLDPHCPSICFPTRIFPGLFCFQEGLV